MRKMKKLTGAARRSKPIRRLCDDLDVALRVYLTELKSISSG